MYVNDDPNRGNIIGFLSFALTLAYAIYIVSYFRGIATESVGSFIATGIVNPHLICVVLATIFSAVGRFAHKRWGMLTAGILLAVSAVLMLAYAPFVLVQMVMCFITFAIMA